jgi:nucleotide-binding universal stress UspA family protein
VPYGGSRFTDKALEMRLGLQGYLEQIHKLFLLHVAPHIPILLTFERPVNSAKTGKSILLTQYMQEPSEEMDENASKMLEEVRRKCAYYNVKIEPILLGGYPADKIIEFANNEKVDLIVIGSVSLSRLLKVKGLGVFQGVLLRVQVVQF